MLPVTLYAKNVNQEVESELKVKRKSDLMRLWYIIFGVVRLCKFHHKTGRDTLGLLYCDSLFSSIPPTLPVAMAASHEAIMYEICQCQFYS